MKFMVAFFKIVIVWPVLCIWWMCKIVFRPILRFAMWFVAGFALAIVHLVRES